MQPLDRTTYGPLKQNDNAECDKWLVSNAGRWISVYDQAEIFGRVYEKTAGMSKAVSGFQCTGGILSILWINNAVLRVHFSNMTTMVYCYFTFFNPLICRLWGIWGDSINILLRPDINCKSLQSLGIFYYSIVGQQFHLKWCNRRFAFARVCLLVQVFGLRIRMFSPTKTFYLRLSQMNLNQLLPWNQKVTTLTLNWLPSIVVSSSKKLWYQSQNRILRCTAVTRNQNVLPLSLKW